MSEKPPPYSENYGTIPESSPPGGWTAPPPPPSYDNLGKFFFGAVLSITQCAERILNKIVKPFNKTFIGLKYMAQGLKICFK